MLLSIDWDAFSGTRELVFDAPIWGTRDREHDRLEAWRERMCKRSGTDWNALGEDFPLYSGWEALGRYAGIPAFVTLSHADAWTWLERYPGQDVLNLDSHHDLVSLSGDGTRVRPGNWAGLALKAGLVRSYTCQYPEWHSHLPVAEGFDLARTWAELSRQVEQDWLKHVTLTRSAVLPDPAGVLSILLVQSPAWTNPAHDTSFLRLAGTLQAETVVPPRNRADLM